MAQQINTAHTNQRYNTMASPSRNKYYNHPDLTDIKNQLADIMGFGAGSASADRNYLSDLRGVSKLEGNMMDNRKKEGTWNALQKALGVEGVTPFEALGLHKATGSGDLWSGRETQELLSGKKKKQEHELYKKEQERKLLDIIGGTKQRLPSYIESGEGIAKGAREDQLLDDMTLEDAARKFKLITGIGGSPTSALDMTGRLAEKEFGLKKDLNESKILLNQTKEDVAEKIGAKKMEKVSKEIDEIVADIANKKKLNATQIMEIKNRALANWSKTDMLNQTQRDRQKLLRKQVEVETEKLLGEKSTTSKKISEATIAKKKLWATSGDLYRKQRKQEVELKKLKAQLAKATDDAKRAKILASIAEKTKEHKITLAEQNALAATSKATTAKAKATIAEADEKDYKAKLKNLQEKRKAVLEEAQIKLANAKTDRDKKKLQLKKEKAIEGLDKQIKDLQIELAKVNILSKSRESLTKTPSPSDLELIKLLRKAQILKTQGGGGGGDGTIPDGEIDVPVPTKKTAQWPAGEREARAAEKSIFLGLKAAPDLKNWGPEQIEAVVQSMMEKYPFLNPEKIIRLINTAKARQ